MHYFAKPGEKPGPTWNCLITRCLLPRSVKLMMQCCGQQRLILTDTPLSIEAMGPLNKCIWNCSCMLRADLLCSDREAAGLELKQMGPCVRCLVHSKSLLNLVQCHACFARHNAQHHFRRPWCSSAVLLQTCSLRSDSNFCCDALLQHCSVAEKYLTERLIKISE